MVHKEDQVVLEKVVLPNITSDWEAFTLEAEKINLLRCGRCPEVTGVNGFDECGQGMFGTRFVLRAKSRTRDFQEYDSN